jgi:hypothetical protein
MNYYLDSTSTSTLEFGTYEYPFKHLIYPFRELFNYFIGDSNVTVILYIKYGTTNILYSGSNPIVITKI